MTDAIRPTCCVEACDELAIGAIDVRWTPVDFRSLPVCGSHFEHVYQVVSRSLVDDQLPLEMRTTLWPDEYLL